MNYSPLTDTEKRVLYTTPMMHSIIYGLEHLMINDPENGTLYIRRMNNNIVNCLFNAVCSSGYERKYLIYRLAFDLLAEIPINKFIKHSEKLGSTGGSV